METLEQLRRQIETANDLGGIVRTIKALAAVLLPLRALPGGRPHPGGARFPP